MALIINLNYTDEVATRAKEAVFGHFKTNNPSITDKDEFLKWWLNQTLSQLVESHETAVDAAALEAKKTRVRGEIKEQ